MWRKVFLICLWEVLLATPDPLYPSEIQNYPLNSEFQFVEDFEEHSHIFFQNMRKKEKAWPQKSCASRDCKKSTKCFLGCTGQNHRATESDPNFMKMFERKYANLVQIDQNRCLQKLTCILAKNESSFEDPVIAHIVRDFESIKTIHSNSPAFPFLAAYHTGLSKQKCDKAYPECPIGFVADERVLDDDYDDISGVADTESTSATTTTSK